VVPNKFNIKHKKKQTNTKSAYKKEKACVCLIFNPGERKENFQVRVRKDLGAVCFKNI